MQNVSQEYKDYVSLPFIPTPYKIYCLLEVINQEAQEQAVVIKDNFEYYSAVGKTVFKSNAAVVNRYATAEDNYVKLDGSSYFLPREGEAKEYFYNGIVLSPLSDNDGVINAILQIQFENKLSYDVKGFIFHFGESYPIDFNIEDLEGTVLHEYRNNNSAILKTSDVYHFKQGFKINALKMNKPYRRFKLEYMEFGMRIEFDNNDIISMIFNEQIQLISTECYSHDLTLRCNNIDDEYNTENPSSTINFLEQFQKLQLYLSIDLPSGSTEQIKIADSNLNEWSSSSTELTLKTSDIFSFLEGQYYKGQYHDNGKSCYDLCTEVLEDAGIDKFIIDPCLKDILIYNPVPNVKHKEAIQLICNASGCVFYQNREGIPIIRKTNDNYMGEFITNDNYLDDIPVGSKLEQVKQLEIYRSVFTKDSENVQLLKSTYSVGRQTVIFNEACYDIQINGATLIESGTYFATFNVINAGEVVITGKKYYITKQATIFDLNDRGSIKNIDNPLVSNNALTELAGNWICQYLLSDREYEFNYRGRSEYDVTDVIGLENKYTDNLRAQIYNHQLSFNGALKGKIKARKVKEWNG